MYRPLGTIHCFLTAGVLLIVALYVASALSCSEGAGPLAAYLDAIRQAQRLNEDKGVISQGRDVTRDIVDQLIEGRLSLPQAAVALCEEDERRPGHLRLPMGLFHLLRLPKEERYMRQLLIRVENELEDDPRHEEVMERLLMEHASVSPAPGD